MAGEELVLQLGDHEVPILQQAAHAAGHRVGHSPALVAHAHLAPAPYDSHRVAATQRRASDSVRGQKKPCKINCSFFYSIPAGP